MVKHLPAMQKTRVQSLGWEDLLGKGTATHSSILAWEISWTEEPGGLQLMGLQKVGNINNLRYADDNTLMAESEELKSLLMKVQKGE